jgi:hypothetical protein
LATPEAFEATLFAAVDASQDADTVAAMACTLSGVYHGFSRLPPRLLAGLEHRGRLLELADGLDDLAFSLGRSRRETSMIRGQLPRWLLPRPERGLWS